MGLTRTIECIINQTYKNLEIIISNNNPLADESDGIVEHYQELDSRIIYFKQASNLGPSNNFNFLLNKSIGQYFMWLSDDDWIDNNYICANLLFLENNIDYKLSSGSLGYLNDDSIDTYTREHFDFKTKDNKTRLLNYLKWKGKYSNWIFYGLIRLDNKNDLEMKDILGMDWIIIARIIFRSKINILNTTCIYKSTHGTSKDAGTLLKSYGLRGIYKNCIFLIVAANIFKDILIYAKVYKKLSFIERLSLATYSFFCILFHEYFSGLSFFLRKRALRIQSGTH